MRKSSDLIRLCAAFFTLTLMLTACGQDTTQTQPGRSPDDAQKLAAACEANVGISRGFNTIFEDIPEPEGPPSPEVTKRIQDGIDKEVLPHVEAVEANAPDEIADEIRIGAKSVRDLRADPSRDPFGDQEVQGAINTIDKYFFENCDFEKTTVQAREYEFSEVPDDISTGELSVRLQNKGKEVHEFVVLTRKEGVSESFDQILQLPEEQGREKLSHVGGAFAEPGKDGYAVFTFEEPGDYIAVCFIPQGTMSDEQLHEREGDPAGTASPGGTASPAGTASPGTTASPTGTAGPTGTPSPGGREEGGPPHFTLGMKKEFKVA